MFRHSFTDKADKLAEIEKTERQVQQQQEREDEMRELALRLRRRYKIFNRNKNEEFKLIIEYFNATDNES